MKNGFTLAEVLITLGVIGVVSAMTLPTLIQNYRKHTVETKLKNEVALIQNAIRMSEAKYGSTSEWSNCTTEKNNSNFDYECSLDVFKTYLATELKVIKICDKDNFTTCWTYPKNATGNLKGYLINSDKTSLSAILSNGSSVYFWVGGMKEGSAYSPHFQLWFDIDGPNKGLAQIGGDVFGGRVNYTTNKGFQLTRTGDDINGLKNNRDFGCSSNITGVYAGSSCGALIQANGWKIPDDYPIRF